MSKPKRYTVTSALPYANGPIHIGHIAGAYLPADIYVRYLKLKGEDVKFLCGSDEHGVPITIRAKKEGITPQEVVDRYHSLNKATFEKFGIDFDIYHRTSDPIHYETASEIFLKLYEKGEFIQDESEQYFDKEAQQFLADRYIEGTCPNCNFAHAYGDQCESCGKSLSPHDLINPKSTLTGNIPIKKKTVHWYLPLDKYQEEWLQDWIETKKGIWKNNVYGQCKSWLDQGLQPRAVTRDLSWGVPVPLEIAKGKVLYVWFDAPIGYISATKALFNQTPSPEGRAGEGSWELYWKKQPDEADNAELIHFIGKDNIVFHSIIFPTILKAESSYIIPTYVPANEFLNLEGDKLSTSRNWAIWLHEYLEEFPEKEDVMRYVLCSIMPEQKDSEFTWKDFQARNNNELVATLGNYVNRILVLTHKYFEGKIGETQQPVEQIFDISVVSKGISSIGENIEKFRFKDALSELVGLFRMGNKVLTEAEPWKLFKENPEQVRSILNAHLQLLTGLAVVMQPFVPFTAKKLAGLLNINLKDCSWSDAEKLNMLKLGHQLNKPELLFEKIEDEIIQAQIDKLYKNEPVETNQGEVKEEITFDDFIKSDLRVGKILTAEKVEKADKLLKFTVDLGFEKRTIVSGIAEFFKPEDVIGKQVSVVVNLAPRKIRGILSQGMILMAEDKNGQLNFVSPDTEVAAGCSIG